MKIEVRGFTIAYAKRKAKNKKDEAKKTTSPIKGTIVSVRKVQNQSTTTYTNTNYSDAFKTNNQQNVKGAIIRSKARWVEYGKKNTRNFLNLEKRRGEKKSINKLKLTDGTETEDQEVILKEEGKFYTLDLYESSSNNKEIPESKIFFQNKLIKPLSEESAKICEGKATKEECINSLNEMKNDKSPGSDGLTSEFYKRFWEEIGDDVVQSINSAFDKGELSICQKRGIITLLPKNDKPTDVLNNLRPVTLLNVDYNIATKVIANRSAKVLPDIKLVM